MRCKNKKCAKRAKRIFAVTPRGEKVFGTMCKHCGFIEFEKPISFTSKVWDS